jgi:tetratricopeptide (TPR) repeat protein
VEALNGLGSVAMHMGNFAKAITYLEKALHLARDISNKVSECDSLESLARLHHVMGNDQVAFQYSKDALALARELNLPAQQANSLADAADAMVNLGQIEDAGKNYQDALVLARQVNDIHQIIDIQAQLAVVTLAQGYHTQALEIVEEILNRISIGDQINPEGVLRPIYSQLEGTKEPFLVLLSCYRVLQANHDHRAEQLLNDAFHLLQEQVNHLPAGQAQANYLENIPAHRELRKLYDQLKSGIDKPSQ